MAPPSHHWLPEHEDELRRLFYLREDGNYLSHTVIGARLSKTRNAVIGKIHRLKLNRDPLISCKGVDNRIVPPATERKGPKMAARPVYGRTSRVRQPSYGGPSLAGEHVAGPSPHGISILETTDHTCKFPIGHVGHEGFHFCGDQVGDKKPYCKHHGKICYYPPNARMKDYIPGAGRRW